MSRVKRTPVLGIRWDEDTGWELRCADCANRGQQCYWPLSFEFWRKHSLARCRACWNAHYARRLREKYYASEQYRIDQREKNRLRRQQNRDVERLKEQFRRATWSEEQRQHVRDRQRLAQRRYRARRRLEQAA